MFISFKEAIIMDIAVASWGLIWLPSISNTLIVVVVATALKDVL